MMSKSIIYIFITDLFKFFSAINDVIKEILKGCSGKEQPFSRFNAAEDRSDDSFILFLVF